MTTLGWDVGGSNTKVARVERGRVSSARGRPFELRHAPDALVPLLRDLAAECGALANECGAALSGPPVIHALTMTAELSQLFRTKRDGVAFVLDAVSAAFPSSPVRVFTVDGRFVDPDAARANPIAVAAANWAATATFVARNHPDAVLVDVGTTTADVIPIVSGAVVAEGRTDPDRLASGELVYTGALRTPAEAISSQITVGGRMFGVSAEGFAIAGDVHVWRGDLDPADYSVPAPDGRPATREFAGERLARVICADREMLDHAGVSAIADALANAQVDRIAGAIGRVAARHPSIRTAIVTGLGAFLGKAAAREAGLRVVALADDLGNDAARFAPAAAVALLLDSSRQSPVTSHRSLVVSPEPRAPSPESRAPSPESRAPSPESRAPSPESRVDVVVKVGGGLLSCAEDLDRVLAVIREAAGDRRLLVVPGGGPLADGVRTLDERLGLSDEAAHWMAILAMDQYAHVLADRLLGSVLVADRAEIAAAFDAGRIPILAPSRWMREADPLPHSWAVTSDSIAAWVAGAVAAPKLVLVKPRGAAGADLVDAYFPRALRASVESACVAADQIQALRLSLGEIDQTLNAGG